ncbi:MAG TPA: cytochrome c biogenesis protein CcdA [Mycobacterium sp.]
MPAVTDTVISGSYLLAALLALGAGAVSFASPCVIPLVPGYLSYLAGLVGAEAAVATTSVPMATGRVPTPANTPMTAGAGATGPEPASAGRRVGLAVRSRAVLATALFVVGFTVVFVAQSLAVVGLSRALLANSETLMRVGGAVTVVMGLVMLGLIRPLQNERRLHVRPTGRILGAPLLGAVFAFGWTVCLGPTLVGVLSLANATDWGGSAWRGLSLVIFYCAGLGIPFLLLAFGFGWATGAMGFLRRHTRTIQLIGAISLIVLGLLMLTGLWGTFIAWLQGRIAGVGTVL